ncbi:hypothetical protein IHE44_0009422 [Lamprotornis superbus]|uniref:tRNA (guanine(10)-N(2))-methyltransferase TRMT11 N-terminal domain-containing protein n=1 Tax=Lamprotornis superbus TaxID=245042 RepID=A0A835P4L4_9PASS|nr:hypothetical protein IHE44_0009422 [Lamprotornis superbus]
MKRDGKGTDEADSMCKLPYLQSDSTYKVHIHTFNKTLTQAQKIKKIDALEFLPFKGKVNLKNPEHIFWILEDYGTNPNDVPEEPIHLYFGRWIADGQRELIESYSVKKRHFIGNTSMDACLSFIMANHGRVKPNDIVYDPFVGTANGKNWKIVYLWYCIVRNDRMFFFDILEDQTSSVLKRWRNSGLLISSAHFGAYVCGTDIDYNTIHGLGKASRKNQKWRGPDENIRANLRQYSLEKYYLDALVADSSRPIWRKGMLFDAIITDPPYGIREAPRRMGSQKETVKSVERRYTEEIIPRHPCLKLISNCEQMLSSHTSRRLITMEKVKEFKTTFATVPSSTAFTPKCTLPSCLPHNTSAHCHPKTQGPIPILVGVWIFLFFGFYAIAIFIRQSFLYSTSSLCPSQLGGRGEDGFLLHPFPPNQHFVSNGIKMNVIHMRDLLEVDQDENSYMLDGQYMPYRGHNSFREKYFSGVTKRIAKEEKDHQNYVTHDLSGYTRAQGCRAAELSFRQDLAIGGRGFWHFPSLWFHSVSFLSPGQFHSLKAISQRRESQSGDPVTALSSGLSLEQELSLKCVCTSGPVLAEELVTGSVGMLVLAGFVAHDLYELLPASPFIMGDREAKYSGSVNLNLDLPVKLDATHQHKEEDSMTPRIPQHTAGKQNRAYKVNILLKNVESLCLLTKALSEGEEEPIPLSQQLRITQQMMNCVLAVNITIEKNILVCSCNGNMEIMGIWKAHRTWSAPSATPANAGGGLGSSESVVNTALLSVSLTGRANLLLFRSYP